MKKPKTITQIIVCDLLLLPLQKNRGETTQGANVIRGETTRINFANYMRHKEIQYTMRAIELTFSY